MGDTHSLRRTFVAQVLGTLSLLVPGRVVPAATSRIMARTSLPPLPGRRYVTGVDATGRSAVVDLGDISAAARWKSDGDEGYDFWVIPQLPAPLQEPANPPAGYKPADRAPRGGLLGRLITWAPGFQYPMHTTPTLDFIVVVSGQLELGLENGAQLLGPGDVLIQRGTAHRWRNPGPEPCTFVGVMIDAAPA
jgi:quercetin dioxygenase-like cupin family protein